MSIGTEIQGRGIILVFDRVDTLVAVIFGAGFFYHLLRCILPDTPAPTPCIGHGVRLRGLTHR